MMKKILMSLMIMVCFSNAGFASEEGREDLEGQPPRSNVTLKSLAEEREETRAHIAIFTGSLALGVMVAAGCNNRPVYPDMVFGAIFQLMRGMSLPNRECRPVMSLLGAILFTRGFLRYIDML
ncbi:MAG: hypothetical protein ACPGXY_03595 [Alphaproteobacteria bacterium]